MSRNTHGSTGINFMGFNKLKTYCIEKKTCLVLLIYQKHFVGMITSNNNKYATILKILKI